MRKEIAEGNRRCRLCKKPIKKGELCYSAYIGGRYGKVGVHIHTHHCKVFTPKNCENQVKCITGNYVGCGEVLCKYNNPRSVLI